MERESSYIEFIDPAVAEKVNRFVKDAPFTLADHLGIEVTHIAPSSIQARMAVTPQLLQPFGLLHGGASLVLAETLASVGAWVSVDEKMFDVRGLEINANHLRAVREGVVIGKGTALHQGRNTQVWTVEVTDEAGNLVCVSRSTIAVVKK